MIIYICNEVMRHIILFTNYNLLKMKNLRNFVGGGI